MLIYSVGGSVRDELLHLEPHDFDYVVVNETVDSMLEAGFKQVGAHFPVFLHPITGDEYALARTEKQLGTSYSSFTCFTKDVSLEEDLSRRDFTINAIAKSLSGDILDPYNGVSDLNNKILKITNQHTFTDDPLRVLRLARFSAKFPEFSIDPMTLELSKVIASKIVDGTYTLTSERIKAETDKALLCSKPSNYFTLLNNLHPELLKVLFKVDITNFIMSKQVTVLDIVSNLSWLYAILFNNLNHIELTKLKGIMLTNKEFKICSYMQWKDFVFNVEKDLTNLTSIKDRSFPTDTNILQLFKLSYLLNNLDIDTHIYKLAEYIDICQNIKYSDGFVGLNSSEIKDYINKAILNKFNDLNNKQG